ncbi:hypothetical protein ALQ28_04356, partial [Pseudomonas syringae pv. delphinii]
MYLRPAGSPDERDHATRRADLRLRSAEQPDNADPSHRPAPEPPVLRQWSPAPVEPRRPVDQRHGTRRPAPRDLPHPGQAHHKQWRNHEYKYDAWGNLIEKAVGIVRWQTFTYDCENRLVKTETMADTQVESTSSYQYDSLGRRVGKQSEIKGQSDQKRFLWQGLRMLREESPGQSSLYLYEPGSYAPLARVDQKEGETENKVYYYHTDQ